VGRGQGTGTVHRRKPANALAGTGRAAGVEPTVGEELLEVGEAFSAVVRGGEHELWPPIHAVAGHTPAPDRGMHVTDKWIDRVGGLATDRHAGDDAAAVTEEAKLIASTFEPDGTGQWDRTVLGG